MEFSKYQILIHLFLVLAVSANAGLIHNHTDPKNGRCNLFSGQWVFDSSITPSYNFSSCPFIDSVFDCLKFGRPDKFYLEYWWKPSSCDLPRFNGWDFLKRWSGKKIMFVGKKIMFVGDSLSLNQWNSLVCLLHAADPKGRTSFVRGNPVSYVVFEDYKLSVYLYTTHFLVDVVKEPKLGFVLNLDSIKQGKAWLGMDMLIFNTWHWWPHSGKSQGWDMIQYGSTVTKDMDRLVAFERALTTWGRWVDENVDPSKTKVFFQGISPSHYKGAEWGGRSTCSGEERPSNGPSYAIGRPKEAIIVDKVLKGIRKPVYLLDVTGLSQLRKDAHPSKYSRFHGNDCSHWCIPGLPDTWNQLLYGVLV